MQRGLDRDVGQLGDVFAGKPELSGGNAAGVVPIRYEPNHGKHARGNVRSE